MFKKILIAFIAVFIVFTCVYFFFPGVIVNASMYIERKTAGLEVKSAVIDGHNIMYLEGGKGENILLIHGFGQNKDNWCRMAKFLSPSYHVICVDLPGSGESSKIDSFNYSIKNQTHLLDRFCKKIGLDKFHIAGNSMGGSIVAYYALYAPEKLLSIAFFNSAAVQGSEKSDFIKVIESNGKNPFIIETSADFDEFMKFVFVQVPPVPGPVKQYFIDQAKQNLAFNAKIGKDLHDEDFKINITAVNQKKIRTLVLWGDQDRLCHVSGAYILNKGIAGSKIAIIKDCGHAPMVERPEETAKHYINFLVVR